MIWIFRLIRINKFSTNSPHFIFLMVKSLLV
nr:MAG TPA: hypothetical protein [Bacteriophage sp.]